MKSFIVFAAIVACAFGNLKETFLSAKQKIEQNVYLIHKADLDPDVDLAENGLAKLLAEHGGMVEMGGRIVGGDPAPITQFPWIISMLRLGSHRCGASIITANRLLSAAHCTIGIPGNGFTIRAGSTQHNAGGQVIATTNVINHPQYNAQTLNNDICVMNLASNLVGNAGVASIGMPVQGQATAAGVTATVAGWGATCEGCAGSVGLRFVTKPVVANAQCNTQYGGGITAQMLCAGYAAGGRDACVSFQ